MEYPTAQLEDISRRIQELLGEYHRDQSRSLSFELPWEERTQATLEASDTFMSKAGTEVWPDVHRLLGEIEALLEGDHPTIKHAIRPILDEAKRWADHPTNPLGYAELSSQLARLAGHLSIRVVARPTVFVTFHFSSEDDALAKKFMELFSLEGLNPISGETAQPEDVDDKVRALIDQSAGVIVLFTKAEELKEGGWTTSPWLADEKAFAIGRDKPILLFYEDVISPTQRKGIHGALEYIEFNRQHLEDAFLKAIPYLRAFRQRLLTRR